ncbi:MAG: cell division FtsA domain-containing protein [Bacilli bacterium]
MKEPIIALDFGGSHLKLVIGYVLDHRPFVLYAAQAPLHQAIVHGQIEDREQVMATLKELLVTTEKNTGLKIEKVIFALPAFGLQVFDSLKETSTVANDDTVKRNDITNLLGMMRKEIIDINSQIVAIVPEIYTIVDNGFQYDVPPLGEKANAIRLHAKVHTLSKQVVDDYESILEEVGLKLEKHFIDQYVLGRLLEIDPEAPKKFLLVDIGHDITHVSFFAHKQIYSSPFFRMGGVDLTKQISEHFAITPSQAQELKRLYGYDTRVLTFKPPIFKVEDEAGKTTAYKLDDFRRVVKEELEKFYAELSASLSLIEQEQANFDEIRTLPIILTGGGSALAGLSEFLREKLPTRTFKPWVFNCLGARDPAFGICLGLIKVYDEYVTTIVDERTYVPPVTREAR